MRPLFINSKADLLERKGLVDALVRPRNTRLLQNAADYCCSHIAWHTSEGFAVQFLERESEITYDDDVLNSTCASWTAYAEAEDLVQNDSGI